MWVLGLGGAALGPAVRSRPRFLAAKSGWEVPSALAEARVSGVSVHLPAVRHLQYVPGLHALLRVQRDGGRHAREQRRRQL